MCNVFLNPSQTYTDVLFASKRKTLHYSSLRMWDITFCHAKKIHFSVFVLFSLLNLCFIL